MIQPGELNSENPYGAWSSRGCDVWEAIGAAMTGDGPALRRLLERDPNIARYHQLIHFAAREGHRDAVRLLLDGGADPDAEFHGDDPVTVARDRGHEAVAALLEASRAPHGRVGPLTPITRFTSRRRLATLPRCAHCSTPTLDSFT